MMSEDKVIYDLLKEVREDQKEHTKELEKQSKCLVGVQSDLKYHIKRTDILEDLHKDNQRRIETNKERIGKLEEPRVVSNYLAKKWKFWAVAIALTSAAFTLFEKISKL